jgi:YggT family protein
MAPPASRKHDPGQQARSFTVPANAKSRTREIASFRRFGIRMRPLFPDIEARFLAHPRWRNLLVCRRRNRYSDPDPIAELIVMRAVLDIVLIILDLYVWLLIASAILSWLIAFNVVNTRNQFVASIAEFLYKITEPVLRPIREIMPNFGGLDISPIIVILIIMFLQRVISYYIYPNVI